LFASVGRLAPGVSLADADAALADVASSLVTRHDSYGPAGLALRAEPIREGFVGPLRPAMTLLVSAALILLLVACANTAGIMVMRTADRPGEFAVRSALGASRVRLARQLIVGQMLLFLLGGALGIFAARAGIVAFLAVRPSGLPLMHPPVMDIALLASVFGVIGLFALAFGGLPSLAFTSPTAGNIAIGLRSSIASGSRMRNLFVTCEVAMSLVLLVAGGLMLRSAAALERVDRGFVADGVLSFRLSISGPQYPYQEPERLSGFYDELVRRLGDIPGVRSVGATEQLPLVASVGGTVAYSWLGTAGPIPLGDETAHVTPVSTGYLETIGAWESLDARGGPRAAARRLHPGVPAASAQRFGGATQRGIGRGVRRLFSNRRLKKFRYVQFGCRPVPPTAGQPSMASDQSFVDFVMGQLNEDCAASHKKMFGEYGLYSGEKFFAVICDNRLFVKPTEGGRAFIGDVVEEPAYPGAKPTFLIGAQIDDSEWLSELVMITAAELPAPKPKKKKAKKAQKKTQS